MIRTVFHSEDVSAVAVGAGLMFPATARAATYYRVTGKCLMTDNRTDTNAVRMSDCRDAAGQWWFYDGGINQFASSYYTWFGTT
ncbi:hypothetical protein [Streptomyces chartreusis]|uniref:hypothetical protein n=1 Tax=Streptomyces chartreusis TaxID=1969 RepID=UPI003642982E